jgi:hypothetical protein
MAAPLKVFTRGTLTFCEITIVVFFIASLAAMAAVSCLVVRTMNRQTSKRRLFDLASNHDAA